jgi:hypothetical protein
VRRLVSIERDGGRYTLAGSAEGGDAAAPSRSVLLVHRPDFDVKITELPRLKERELNGYLTYRIRSLYPGDPRETVFDRRVVAIGARSYAVLFITKKKTLEEYSNLFREKPLVTPFILFEPFLKEYSSKETVFSFWHEDWIDFFVFSEEEPLSFYITRTDIVERLSEVVGALPNDPEAYHWIAIGADGRREQCRTQLTEAAGAKIDVDAMPVSEALRRIGRRTRFLFASKRRRAVPQRIRLQLFVSILLFLIAMIYKTAGDLEEQYGSRLEDLIGSLTARASLSIALEKEIESFEQEARELRSRRPNDCYYVFSELHSILADRAVITSFVLEEDRFQFEAVGLDPLRLMESFGASGVFGDVELNQIVPLEGSNRERFRVSGRINVEQA